MGGDARRHELDLGGARDLEAVRPVVVEGVDLEQVVEEGDDLVAGCDRLNLADRRRGSGPAWLAAGNLRPAMANPAKTTATEGDEFLESLMETRLYSMGAYFSDQHPDLVEDVVEQSVAIEQAGIRDYADDHGMGFEECFQMMLTGLALRYYNAVAG
ncbi:MAG: hypothetical protein WD649_04210 [Thermoleophilaceae bacterium]